MGHKTSRDQQNGVGYSRERKEDHGWIADELRLCEAEKRHELGYAAKKKRLELTFFNVL